MAQTKEGALKTSARKRGMSVEEYIAHQINGEKWCYKCRSWKFTEEFDKDSSRGDGLKSVCQKCSTVRKTPGPTKSERRQMKLHGKGYCPMCADWHPLDEMRANKCKVHINEVDRRRYAEDENYRRERRQHAHARKRNVDPIPSDAQEQLLQIFKGLCAYCDNLATTWDHIIPISKGGRTAPHNIVPACARCNSSKGNRDFNVWTGSAPRQEFYDVYDSIWWSIDYCMLPE